MEPEPVKRKKATPKKQRPRKAVAPVSKKVPTTPGEIRDAAVEIKDRAKAVGLTPFVEAAGGLAARLFGALNAFFDGVENTNKKDKS